MFAFQLWREFKLSIAELWSVFPNATFEYVWNDICILSEISQEDILTWAPRMWGIIKAMELIEWYTGKPSEIVLTEAERYDGKYVYGISQFGTWSDLKKVLMDTKKLLRKHSVSSRFVNKNFQSLSSAQILGEKLVDKGTDFSIISVEGIEYFGKTIWVQDIEGYSKRDYGKTRDMQVGMLPPKLAQIMINISGGKKIYDPFCGLGTIPIECILRGNKEVYGSDISVENTKKTKSNIDYAIKEFSNNIKNSEVISLDARGISSSSLLKKSDSIVTEWYLWQVFQKYSITEKKIDEEKQKLLSIYRDFFLWLEKAKYSGIIVISFPFWEVYGKYHYFSEVYKVIEKHCKIEHLLPLHDTIKHTRIGSLLYKRKDQVVWREICKLTIKSK